MLAEPIRVLVQPSVAIAAPRDIARRVAFWSTFGAAAAVSVSIAASQILLGLAILAFLVSRERLRLPPIQLPLALFISWTLAAVALSPDPLGGMPQIKKLFVFALLPLVFQTFKTLGQVRALMLTWAGLAALSAARGLEQFAHRYEDAVAQKWTTYDFFLDGRITGFESHWMTFGGVQMIALLMLAGFLLFARRTRWKLYAGVCLALVWIALVFGLTRSIFLLGVPSGIVYLLWSWKRWTIAALPVLLAAGFWMAPPHVRERVTSVLRPHGDLDSNTHRSVTRRTGWEMVKAHPWFGLGPEQIRPQFSRYVPQDIRRPLPHGWYGHLHNIYLQFAAERGIPALVFLLWFIGKAVYDFFRVARARKITPDARFVLHGAVAAILAILAAGYFEYNLGDSEVLTMFLAVIGCGYASIRSERCA